MVKLQCVHAVGMLRTWKVCQRSQLAVLGLGLFAVDGQYTVAGSVSWGNQREEEREIREKEKGNLG